MNKKIPVYKVGKEYKFKVMENGKEEIRDISAYYHKAKCEQLKLANSDEVFIDSLPKYLYIAEKMVGLFTSEDGFKVMEMIGEYPNTETVDDSTKQKILVKRYHLRKIPALCRFS